jgi:hypothetical protein
VVAGLKLTRIRIEVGLQRQDLVSHEPASRVHDETLFFGGFQVHVYFPFVDGG